MMIPFLILFAQACTGREPLGLPYRSGELASPVCLSRPCAYHTRVLITPVCYVTPVRQSTCRAYAFLLASPVC